MKSMFRSTLILALLAFPLAAQPRAENRHRTERVGRALNLTEAQQTSIRAIHEKHRTDLTRHRDAVQHARIDLRTALQDLATPEARLRTLYNQAAAARFDLMLAQRATRLEVQAVLTPEQRAKATEIRGHAEARMRAHFRRDPGEY